MLKIRVHPCNVVPRGAVPCPQKRRSKTQKSQQKATANIVHRTPTTGHRLLFVTAIGADAGHFRGVVRGERNDDCARGECARRAVRLRKYRKLRGENDRSSTRCWRFGFRCRDLRRFDAAFCLPLLKKLRDLRGRKVFKMARRRAANLHPAPQLLALHARLRFVGVAKRGR